MRALTELKKECIIRLVGYCQCFTCDENKPKRLLIHHHGYFPDSVVYNKFEESDDGRLKYYAHLLDEIKEREENFTVLCVECHNYLEKHVKSYLAGNGEVWFEDNACMQVVYDLTIHARDKNKPKLSEYFWT